MHAILHMSVHERKKTSKFSKKGTLSHFEALSDVGADDIVRNF
eukprot:UN16491